MKWHEFEKEQWRQTEEDCQERENGVNITFICNTFKNIYYNVTELL